jgi:hypothetical protein
MLVRVIQSEHRAADDVGLACVGIVSAAMVVTATIFNTDSNVIILVR